MPRFDGTGPQGEGPLTGRGDGYCAVARPDQGQPYGLAGLRQRPFGGFLGRLAGWSLGLGRRGRGAGRGAGRGRRRW
ncbi:MAG: DUF5320 domain-containing protein [Anaerolineae bacterium]|nr:DUF5320 domain-containing protein [Anaerolineae bacterium]